ncbi:MAG: DUF2333 family protein [Pseudomonadales bacterium]|nr:DUF2333 family protein [Pseudomonadales bacterium]
MNWKFWQRAYPSVTGAPERRDGNPAVRIALLLLVVALGGIGLIGWWWDTEPDQFDVIEAADRQAASTGQTVVKGYIMANTVRMLGRTLLDKPGGYLSNDVVPPGAWMDNMPEWEFGVLTQIRDVSRAFRIDFSRSQSQSIEDEDLKEAEGRFFFDNSSWAFPQSEDEYEAGIRHFRSYLKRLADPNQPKAQFYARADNLAHWLEAVETRLGSLSQRLSASVGKRQLNIDLAGESGAMQSTPSPHDEEYKTPWLEIDDVFFDARGQCWALLHLLRAAEQDFGEVLDRKNARVSLQQIIRELEPTQETVWSPMILNGDGLGFLANHSLVMASYISRSNAAIIDLRSLLASG